MVPDYIKSLQDAETQTLDELSRIQAALKAFGGKISAPIPVSTITARHDGLHWTQRPENKDRLRKMARKSARTRAANGKH